MSQGDVRTKEEWEHHFNGMPTDVLLEILGTTKRSQGKLTPSLIENRELIVAILEKRGLSRADISKLAHTMARRKEAEPYQPIQPDVPQVDYSTQVFLSAFAISLALLGCLGWLIYQKAIQYKLSDPALRHSFFYGVLFGLVLKFWLSRLRDKIEAGTNLYELKSPFFAPHYVTPSIKDWFIYFSHVLLHSVLNTVFSILLTICLLLYSFHNLTEGYRALLSISIFVLVFSSLKWALNKYAPGERLFGIPSMGFLTIVTFIFVGFTFFMGSSFSENGWTNNEIFAQCVLTAITFLILWGAFNSARKR